jgi:hypothetical protein
MVLSESFHMKPDGCSFIHLDIRSARGYYSGAPMMPVLLEAAKSADQTDWSNAL